MTIEIVGVVYLAGVFISAFIFDWAYKVLRNDSRSLVSKLPPGSMSKMLIVASFLWFIYLPLSIYKAITSNSDNQ